MPWHEKYNQIQTVVQGQQSAVNPGPPPGLVKGSVTAFGFVNPHALVHLAVKTNAGNLEEWTADTAPPIMLRRAGWDRATLKPGDAITVSGYQAKDGSRHMSVPKWDRPGGIPVWAKVAGAAEMAIWTGVITAAVNIPNY
jgi:hypothetical protein